MSGKYQGSTATSSATAVPNTPRLLWSDTIGGGAVSDENALGLHLEAGGYGTQTGEVWATLNGQEVFRETVGGETTLVADLDVWRNTPSTADVSGFEAIDGISGQIADRAVTGGLAWGSSQTLAIYGQSSATGGILLRRAGVLR